MVVCIHQPEHLPWLGLIHKISISDIYVVLDNVQFKKNYFENRNKIYTVQGLQWITLPIKMQGHIEKKFYEMEIVEGWKKKYLPFIMQNYKKAPFYSDIESILDVINSFEGTFLADLNLLIISELCNVLDIKTRIIRANEMKVIGKKTELLIDILKQLKATEYIVGKSGFDYMDLNYFSDNKINLSAHSFSHPKYKPYNFTKFTDIPSVIDVIANLGKFKVMEAIKNQNDY